ncbi:unnamed protein product [Amoebophrya sp. A120]|nr:unnamed protein product [Amoebophrya sp. A120]|eukprot:GSA120T00017909001.1
MEAKIEALKKEYARERRRRKQCEAEIRWIQSNLKSNLNEESLTQLDHSCSFKRLGGEFGEWQRKLAIARAIHDQAEQEAPPPEKVEYDGSRARQTFEKTKQDFHDNRYLNRETFRFC